MAPKIHGRFTPPEHTGEENKEPSLTQQHFAAEANINTIIQRALKTGTLGDVTNARQPIFGDFTATDYMEMRNAVADVTQQFEALPARIRSRFMNDPLQLMRFVNDPRNLAESVKLGFVKVPQGFYVNDEGKIMPGSGDEPKPMPKASKAEEKAPEAPKADPEANPHKGT